MLSLEDIATNGKNITSCLGKLLLVQHTAIITLILRCMERSCLDQAEIHLIMPLEFRNDQCRWTHQQCSAFANDLTSCLLYNPYPLWVELRRHLRPARMPPESTTVQSKPSIRVFGDVFLFRVVINLGPSNVGPPLCITPVQCSEKSQ